MYSLASEQRFDHPNSLKGDNNFYFSKQQWNSPKYQWNNQWHRIGKMQPQSNNRERGWNCGEKWGDAKRWDLERPKREKEGVFESHCTKWWNARALNKEKEGGTREEWPIFKVVINLKAAAPVELLMDNEVGILALPGLAGRRWAIERRWINRTRQPQQMAEERPGGGTQSRTGRKGKFPLLSLPPIGRAWLKLPCIREQEPHT